MSSYHIDQLGRVVMQVADTHDTDRCYGCLYEHDRLGRTRDCQSTAPVENEEDWRYLCSDNGTIFVLVDTTE